MNEIDKELYRLLGDKSPTIGCKFILPTLRGDDEILALKREGTFTPALTEMLGHEPTITDFHRWLYINVIDPETWFMQDVNGIHIGDTTIEYRMTHSLMEQELGIRNEILNFINSHS